ncbi:MAG: phospho-N-acetylmuramoyl-pentapeptide-transferase [Thermacetogeniaceae bacterium]
MNEITGVGIALVLSLLSTLLLGKLLVPLLNRLKFGQEVRDDGPKSHLKKQGTATMGGLLIIGGTGVASLLVAGQAYETLLLVGMMVGCGLLGFADDFLKVVLKRSLGVKARTKFLVQILLGLALAWAAFSLHQETTVLLPFTGFRVDLGVYYYALVVFILVAAANAVNLTDGLDGLASGLMLVVAVAFVLIAWMTGQNTAAVFAGALGGSCLGFLYFNHYPARVFMGDTGSLALGGAMATLAVLTRTELVLLILGGVFVLETLSVIIQVISYQLTGKRVFRMSPLHHHFELSGWTETRVVRWFWMLGLCCAVLSFWAMRGPH